MIVEIALEIDDLLINNDVKFVRISHSDDKLFIELGKNFNLYQEKSAKRIANSLKEKYPQYNILICDVSNATPIQY